MSALAPERKVHVVGVGGAGMSGLAILLAEMGALVSGSDQADTPVLQELRDRGVTIYGGHAGDNVRDAEVILWSPAVREDNVELVAARALGVEMMSRAHAFFELSTMKRVFGLTGTHGKTTATSMMVQISLAAGRDDAWLLGAPVTGVGANGHWGDGDLILEVDESYGTFEELRPFALGLLNIEPDHLDHYGSPQLLEAAFSALVERTSGPVVAWGDDEAVARLARSSDHALTLVGSRANSSWRVRDVTLERRGASFVLDGPGETLDISLRVTGRHNVANASVTAVLARTVGIEADAVLRGLSNFVGAPRRYQYRGAWRGVDVYEDYAHLPGEIAATLRAARDTGYQRVTVVFQPHRVTRTLALVEHFAGAFRGARHVIVTNVYDAGENNPTGVTGEIVVEALRRHDPLLDVRYSAELDHVVLALEEFVNDSDVILVLGAGDVGSVITSLPGGVR